MVKSGETAREVAGGFGLRRFLPDVTMRRISVRNPRKVLKTSFRSATHATDSTCNGCQAKIAATQALRQSVPVRRRSKKKSRTPLRR